MLPIINHIKNVQLHKIQNDTIQTLVSFNLESIPKYSNSLVTAENRFNEIQSTIANLIKENPNYNNEVLTLQLMKNKWKWDGTLKGTPYKVLTDSRCVESNTFLGYSFALVHPAVSMRALN